MVHYVDQVTAPMERHIEEHDAWHRGRLEADNAAIRGQQAATNMARSAQRNQTIAFIIAATAVAVDIIRGIIGH